MTEVTHYRTADESRAIAAFWNAPEYATLPKPDFQMEDAWRRFEESGWDGLLPEEKEWVEREFEATWGRPMRGLDGEPDPNHMH